MRPLRSLRLWGFVCLITCTVRSSAATGPFIGSTFWPSRTLTTPRKQLLGLVRGGADHKSNEERQSAKLGSTSREGESKSKKENAKEDEKCPGGVCPMPSAAYSAHSSTRGGDQSAAPGEECQEEGSLDERVHAAMKRMGLTEGSHANDNSAMEARQSSTSATTVTEDSDLIGNDTEATIIERLTKKIESALGADRDLIVAALGATSTVDKTTKERIFNEQAATRLVETELERVQGVAEDDPNLKLLVDEGHDSFLARRALAFAEGNLENARAILIAEQEELEK